MFSHTSTYSETDFTKDKPVVQQDFREHSPRSFYNFLYNSGPGSHFGCSFMKIAFEKISELFPNTVSVYHLVSRLVSK